MWNVNIAGEKYMECFLTLAIHVPDKYIYIWFNWIIQLLQNIYLLSGKCDDKKVYKIIKYEMFLFVLQLQWTIDDVKIKHQM